MSKNKKFLKAIAAENQTMMKDAFIPKTIRMKYDESKITKCPTVDETNVFFLEMTTCDCVQYIHENDISENIYAHNFASETSPGGGYENGAKAQEEYICYRTPRLYPSIVKEKYPLEPTTVLITPNLEIMRDEDYELLEKDKFVKYGIVSAAAQNLSRPDSKYNDQLTKRTLANIFCSVKLCDSKVDTLVLGAWGCGVFANDPYTIANEIKDAINKYGGHYKNIFIAIPSGPNVEQFKDVFGFSSESDEESEESKENEGKKNQDKDDVEDIDVERERFEEESNKKRRSKKSDRKTENARKHGISADY